MTTHFSFDGAIKTTFLRAAAPSNRVESPILSIVVILPPTNDHVHIWIWMAGYLSRNDIIELTEVFNFIGCLQVRTFLYCNIFRFENATRRFQVTSSAYVLRETFIFEKTKLLLLKRITDVFTSVILLWDFLLLVCTISSKKVSVDRQASI